MYQVANIRRWRRGRQALLGKVQFCLNCIIHGGLFSSLMRGGMFIPSACSPMWRTMVDEAEFLSLSLPY